MDERLRTTAKKLCDAFQQSQIKHGDWIENWMLILAFSPQKEQLSYVDQQSIKVIEAIFTDMALLLSK